MPTDTNSLMHKIGAENVYEDFYQDEDLFHYNNLPKDSEYYDHENNIAVGKMKDETTGVPMEIFVRQL